MRRLRNWSTPLAGAVFAIMAATGIAMFFDVGTPGGETLHTWLGWGLVTAIVLHLTTNWASMKTHFGRGSTRAVLGVALVVAIIAVVPLPGVEQTLSPGRKVLIAVSDVPLSKFAPIVGREVDSIVSELRAGGFGQASPESTINGLAGQDEEKRAKVVDVIFARRGGGDGRRVG